MFDSVLITPLQGKEEVGMNSKGEKNRSMFYLTEELSETTKMESFTALVNGWKLLPIVVKHPILDVSESSGYVYA